MAPTIFTLRPDLNAAAYLIEIMIAEALFLRPYKKRENFAARYIASGLLLLVLGTVTGIPSLAGFPRFLWFFAAMAGCIAAVCFCYEEDIFTLTSVRKTFSRSLRPASPDLPLSTSRTSLRSCWVLYRL